MTPRVRDLCAWLRGYADTRLSSKLMDERRCIPPHVVIDLGNRGLLGMHAPVALGGLGMTQPEVLAIAEQLGAIDLTLAIFVGIHNALGIRPIASAGGEALVAELVPQLATGRMLGAFAMTERAAGSNARNIETRAVADGDGWRLRGSKIWVGNGSWAGVINVLARRPPEEGGGMSAFAVRVGTPGLRMGAEALTTGMRAIVQNEVHLDDVRVSRADLLGAPGAGFDVASDSFGVARLGISAIALGGLRRATQLAQRYASRRQISTGPLAANARTREVLAALVAATSAVESLLQLAGARCEGAGPPPPELSAICKAIVPELLGHAADRVTQLLGGRGYIETNELPQLVRDARLLRIFEGPTETLEMHLGAAVLGDVLSSATLFEGLAAPRARAAVERWIERLASAVAGTTGEARIVAGQRGKLAIGHVVAWGVLAAAAEQRSGAVPDDAVAELAAHWALAELEVRAEAVARAHVVADPAVLARAIAGYRDVIGEVEQALPGADDARDPMLRRDP